MDLSTLTTLEENGFKVIHLIGQGGFGKVYLVNWELYPDEQFVAKFVFIPDKDRMSHKNQYINEINALSHLFHKNIIKIYRTFMVNQYMVVVMEYCVKGTVHDYIEKFGPVFESVFKRIAQETLEAVAFCHQKGVTHRDIKPSNLMIDKNDRLKLCDFGCSDPSHDNLITRQDGSLNYLSPEILTGKPYNPKKADIWALGITFYYMTCGRLPWESMTREDLKQEISVQILSFPPFVSHEVQYIIYCMTRKDPNERPSAEEILNLPFFREKEISRPKKIISRYSSAKALYQNANRKLYTCKLMGMKSTKTFMSD